MGDSAVSTRLHLASDEPSHILSEPISVRGREFVSCSCGLRLEIYGIRPLPTLCPIAEAWSDYRETVAVAARRRDEAIQQWNTVSGWHQRDAQAAG